jgi:hypothetical protein
MMATNVGNLNIRLGMSTDKLNTDVNAAVGSVNRLDSAFNRSTALNPRGSTRADNNMNNRGFVGAQAIQQSAFAMQDFTSQFMNAKTTVDGLGRGVMAMSNNVQMLGAAFGPTALAVTAIGGAITAVVIPGMIRWLDLSKEATKEADRLAMAMERQADLMGKMRAARGEGGLTQLESERRTIRETEESLKFLNGRIADASNKINEASNRDIEAHRRMVAEWDVPGRFRAGLNQMFGGTGVAESQATANAKKELDLLRESIRERELILAEAREREKKIEKEFGPQIRQQEERRKQREAWESELESLREQGVAANSSPSASIRGTGAAASAINRAVSGTRSEENDRKQQIKILEDLLKSSKALEKKLTMGRAELKA